ncbi:hypothetical protein L7F22_018965 [Adiantum nelumboides]|nr:hypothetical protein [Adiantum nelumboides]
MAGHLFNKLINKLEGGSGGGGGGSYQQQSGGYPQYQQQQGYYQQPPPPPQQVIQQGSNQQSFNGAHSKIHVGYFTNWSIYGRKYHPNKIPVQQLSHILYAFGDVREDGTVFLTDSWSDVEIHYDGDSWEDGGKNLYGNFKQLLRMKQQNRHLKILLSIGGWTFSSHFSAVKTSQGRTQFVRSAMKILEDVGLDGLDIDWEYPKDGHEADQYVQLLGELRQALDARANAMQSRHWLSIAAPCGEQMQTLHVARMDAYLDMWNLMAYDFCGTWSERSSHQANLLPSQSCEASVEQAIQFYTSQGVAPHKLILGMPLYARAFANTKGLGHKFNGVPEGGAEPGNFNYRDLPLPQHEEQFDSQALAQFSICPQRKEFASYEGPQSVDAKCDYIHKRGLGGAMWWEVSGDADEEKGGVERALIPRTAYRLGNLDPTPNNLHFPYSQYDNVRSGQPL